MRMWMVKPELLCRQHLNGEHGELHKFLWTFKAKYKVKGRIKPFVQIQLSSYKQRHDELAKEINKRGGKHKSPLLEVPDFSYLPKEHYEAKVDIKKSIRDLKKRCKECKQRIENENINKIS